MKLKMEEIEKFLKEKAYEESDINKILSHSTLPKQNSETLLTNIKEIYGLLSSLGYNQQEIIKITKDLPTVFCLKTENIIQKIEKVKKSFFRNLKNIKEKIKNVKLMRFKD